MIIQPKRHSVSDIPLTILQLVIKFLERKLPKYENLEEIKLLEKLENYPSSKIPCNQYVLLISAKGSVNLFHLYIWRGGGRQALKLNC